MSKVKYIVAFTDGTCKAYAKPIEGDAEAGIRAIIAATPYVRIPKGFVLDGVEYPLTPAKPKASRKAAAKAAPQPVVAEAPKPETPKRKNAHAAMMAGRSKAAKAYQVAYRANLNADGSGHVKATMKAHTAALAA